MKLRAKMRIDFGTHEVLTGDVMEIQDEAEAMRLVTVEAAEVVDDTIAQLVPAPAAPAASAPVGGSEDGGDEGQAAPVEMPKKAEIIAALREAGIEHDPASTKAVLFALLNNPAPAGEESDFNVVLPPVEED